MSPLCVAPISRTKTSVLSSAARTVRGNPISLLKLPAVAETRRPLDRKTASRASLTVVLPTVPVTPTTLGEFILFRLHRASSCNATSGSSTTTVGTGSGREATAATAPLRYASGAKSAPSVRPCSAKKSSPPRTLRESTEAPVTRASAWAPFNLPPKASVTAASETVFNVSCPPFSRLGQELDRGEVLGVSGGGEAYKRGNVLVAVESRLGVDLLRGPGFAGHRVPGDLGKMARPFVDHALEHPPYYRRGLLAYHPRAGRFGGGLLGHVRRHLKAAVSERGVARRELQGGYGQALTDRDVAYRRAAPLLKGRHAPRVLAP